MSSAAGLFDPVTPVRPVEVSAPRHVAPEQGPPTIVFPVAMLEQVQWPMTDPDPPPSLRTVDDVALRDRILSNLRRIRG